LPRCCGTVDPVKFGSALKQMKTASIAQVVQAVRTQPAGAELDAMPFDEAERKMANRAVTVGLLPTIPVNSTNGERSFSYTPYSGMLIAGETSSVIAHLSPERAVDCSRAGTYFLS